MINKKSILFTSLLALAISFSASANKPIYKWKDGQGNIKYTQSKPPRGTQFEVIYQRTSNSQNDQQSQGQETQPQEQSPEDTIIAKQNQEKERVMQANKEVNRKNCTIAKNNIETLETNTRVATVVDGERRLLTDKERQDKLATAKSNRDKFCQ